MRLAATAAVLAVLALAGCSSADSGGSAAPPPAAGAPATQGAASTGTEPRTEAAVRAAATEEFDSYAAGDYGAAWDVWTAAGKKAISRANYVKLFQLCPEIAQGVRFEIQKVALDNDHEAHVRASRMGIAVQSFQFVYESGHWRFVPLPDAMNDYRTKTINQMAADRRAQGGCGQ
jgi:hypothetical protein